MLPTTTLTGTQCVTHETHSEQENINAPDVQAKNRHDHQPGRSQNKSQFVTNTVYLLFTGADKNYVRFKVQTSDQYLFCIRRPSNPVNSVGVEVGSFLARGAIDTLRPKVLHSIFKNRIH